MFKKDYQGGSHVEVFSAQGHDPLAQWKLTGSVSREYLKDVRGFVVALEGGSSTTNTRMQLPKTDKGSLALVQPYLVFQLMVPAGARLALDLSVIDKSGNRRRVQMSTSQREVAATPLNARVPLASIITGQWVNLCFDLDSLVSGLFKGQLFKSLEGMVIGGSCLIRRVFTLKSPPPDTTVEPAVTDGLPFEEIPQVYQMPTGGLTIQTQVLSYANLSSPVRNKQSTTCSTKVSTKTPGTASLYDNLVSTEERPTHIAFGKKVVIPDHILSSKQSSRSALPSKQSPAESERKGKGKELHSLDGQNLQPHPPSKPSDLNILRMQNKRIRIISKGKQKPSTMTEKSGSGHVDPSVTSYDSGFQPASSEAASVTYRSECTVDESFPPKDTAAHTGTKQHYTVLSSVDSHLDQEEHFALDALQTKRPDDGRHQVDNTDGLSGDPKLLDTSATISARQDCHSSVDEVLYLYRSLPKSAERKQSDFEETLEGGRNAALDEDFVSPIKKDKPKILMQFVPSVAEVRPKLSRNQNRGVPIKDSQPVSFRNKQSGVTNLLSKTRLSEDYDWRQYASVDGTDMTLSEQSLRTRLANVGYSQKETAQTLNIGPLNSEMEVTLSGSVTQSGWTEKFKDAAINPLHDSLDTGDMGGMLSPLMGTLTEEPDFAVDPAKRTGEEELELMYDPQLNCFYDPNTGKYYELA